jgi:hypothetical protein
MITKESFEEIMRDQIEQAITGVHMTDKFAEKAYDLAKQMAVELLKWALENEISLSQYTPNEPFWVPNEDQTDGEFLSGEKIFELYIKSNK